MLNGQEAGTLRLFAAFTALGAGLTFFALSANALLAGYALLLPVGIAASTWAAAHTLWGLLVLRGRARPGRVESRFVRLVSRALPVVAAVVLGAVVWTALLAPADTRRVDLTLVSALVLLLLQLGCQGALRRRPVQPAPPPGRLLAGLFLSALLVAGVTTPGLAASTAGDSAVPHGEHTLLPVPSKHGH
ncbi:hypothetical protein GC088_05475 [Arthrobacter sp. JZ12]|uniref:hypothetical protein n=1 Tax=Arthrobacter sp. JZ12 TaxID=2654190 RepID=UPI002B471E1A|nr:hypothetical protein [Arthrobacter sp. JZ12]WRH24578.1 hypothetical protein GC088_05475 [Arthrobacter sp. JZ12]